MPLNAPHLQESEGDDTVFVPIHGLEKSFGGKRWDFGTGKHFGGNLELLGSIWGEKGEILRGRALKLVIFGNSWNDLMGFGGNEGISVF